MRILIFNWRDPAHPRAGGAEVFTHELASHWVRAGHEVTQFSAAAPGLPEHDDVDGVRLIRRGGRFGVYREARRFYERQGRGKFDLVIDEINTRPFLSPRFVDDAQVVALAHQVAREVWFHEMPRPLAAAGCYVLEPRWLRAYRDVPVLTISESSRRSLLAYGLPDVRVISVGVNLPEPMPDAKKETVPTVLFCGRLASNKRPDHAVSAFRRIQSSISDAQLWVIGSGPLEGELRRQAPEGVSFFGKVGEQEKYEIMARAHVLVATSVREGWGMVVTEAAAVGTPSIGYDVSGLRDSVPLTGGVLVEPTVDALVMELQRRLPEWVRNPAAFTPYRAPSWDAVASEVLSSCVAQPAIH